MEDVKCEPGIKQNVGSAGRNATEYCEDGDERVTNLS